MKRKILVWIIRRLMALLTRRDIRGLENVPLTGGYILAPNHLSMLDPPLIATQVQRNDLTAMAAHKHRENPFLRWIIEAMNGIWLNREEADSQAIRAAIEYLRGGGMLGIAPEGTRSRSGVLLEGKNGVAYLADKAGVPVIPVALWGTEIGFAEIKRLRRPLLHMRVGKPLVFPPVARRERDVALQRNTDELMCQIAAMLPEAYHGAYAGHPRIREIIEQQAVS